jgi:hypothetical protein
MRFKEFMEAMDDLAATADFPTTPSSGLSATSDFPTTSSMGMSSIQPSGRVNIDQIKAQSPPEMRLFIGWYNSSRGSWSDVMRASGAPNVKTALAYVQSEMKKRNGIPVRIGRVADILQHAVTTVVPQHAAQTLPQVPLSYGGRNAKTSTNAQDRTAQASGMMAQTGTGDNNATRMITTRVANHEERIGRLEKALNSGQPPSASAL